MHVRETILSCIKVIEQIYSDRERNEIDACSKTEQISKEHFWKWNVFILVKSIKYSSNMRINVLITVLVKSKMDRKKFNQQAKNRQTLYFVWCPNKITKRCPNNSDRQRVLYGVCAMKSTTSTAECILPQKCWDY